MCVLCGEALTQIHWTDKRSDTRTAVSTAAADNAQRSRLRDRYHLVQLTNKILCHYGLQLNDWNGSKYVLSDKKGSSVIVQDLGGLWPAAEKLIHRALDPLDPTLLESLLSQ
ncbi:MAG: hypothetical protein NVS2B12_25200 [Ktedonobacteraceae bacterium]